MNHIHESKVGTYHPNPASEVAWTINDTRGYIDPGDPCDECGACECGTCENHKGKYCLCDCDALEDFDNECSGLSFAYVLLDGGDNLCTECAKKEGIEIVPCNCA